MHSIGGVGGVKGLKSAEGVECTEATKGAESAGGREGTEEVQKFIGELQPYETLLLDSRPHKHYFLNLKIGYGLSTILWVYLIVISALNIPIENTFLWLVVVFVAIILATAIYILSESIIKSYKVVLWLQHVWIFILILTLSLISIVLIQREVEALYPKEWWEEFLGFPFGLAAIVFCIIILITSSILWKIAFLTGEVYAFPLRIASIMLIAISVFSLLLPLHKIVSQEVIGILFLLFSIIIIIHGGIILAYIHYRGGLRFIATNKRLISISSFLKKKIDEYFYSGIEEIIVYESCIGKRYGFGDLTIIATGTLFSADGTGQRIVRRKITIQGVENPYLVRNTILAFATYPKKTPSQITPEITPEITTRKPPAPHYTPSPLSREFSTTRSPPSSPPPLPSPPPPPPPTRITPTAPPSANLPFEEKTHLMKVPKESIKKNERLRKKKYFTPEEVKKMIRNEEKSE